MQCSPIRRYLVVMSTYQFAASFSLAILILFLRFQGLGMHHIGMLLATRQLATACLELPTGAFADLLGRKWSFLLACWLSAGGFLLLYASSTIYWLIGAFLLLSAAVSFYSGSLDAWAVDACRTSDGSSGYTRLFSRARTVKGVVFLVAGIGGTLLASIQMSLPLLVSALMMVVASLTGLLLLDSSGEVAGGGRRSTTLRDIVRQVIVAVSYGASKTTLALVILGSALIAMFFEVSSTFWQPYFHEVLGYEVRTFGAVWASILLGYTVGSYLSAPLSKRLERHRLLQASISLTGMPILFLALWRGNALIGLALIAAYQLGRGIAVPVYLAYMNELIPAEVRATVLSTHSLAGQLLSALGTASLTLLASFTSISYAWSWAVVIFLTCSFVAVGWLQVRVQPRRNAPSIAQSNTRRGGA